MIYLFIIAEKSAHKTHINRYNAEVNFLYLLPKPVEKFIKLVVKFLYEFSSKNKSKAKHEL